MGFRVWGLGFRGLNSVELRDTKLDRIQGLGIRDRIRAAELSVEDRVEGLGFSVICRRRYSCLFPTRIKS